MRYLLAFLIITALVIGAFFIFMKSNVAVYNPKKVAADTILSVPEATPPPASKQTATSTKNLNSDIENQNPLPNPPETIKAVYSTSWSAGTASRINYLIDLIKSTELNAIVIDLKDFSGTITYNIQMPDAVKYGAREIRIPRINALIKRLHDENIYVIGRITIFQDPILAENRPELAIHSVSKITAAGLDVKNIAGWQGNKKTLWLDHKKLAWIDPASKAAWDYNIAIVKDALSRGFDEINFDYIRFASDGNLKDMAFPNWNGKETKSETIKDFFKYLRTQLGNAKISADLFGLATVSNDDLGIGQVIKNAYPYFDYVAPMVYPSHYYAGTDGYKKPAEHPYEIIRYSMDAAFQRLITSNQQLTTASASTSTELSVKSKLRPWLQDFNLGAIYDAAMVDKEIKAVYDSASSTPELLNGWMLWNPSNMYTKGALKSN